MQLRDQEVYASPVRGAGLTFTQSSVDNVSNYYNAADLIK